MRGAANRVKGPLTSARLFRMNPQIAPIALLVASNVFMTFAWYGHLKFKAAPLWGAVLVSWGIAFLEYWFAVPANRTAIGE